MSDWQREDRVKLYLGYLEVEMTIMGILSAFCIVAAGFVMKEVMAAKEGFMVTLWAASADYLIFGSILLVGGALWFYRQRSALAWYHGHLCLALQEDSDKVTVETSRELLVGADSWDNWVHYHRGFVFIAAGMCELFAGLVMAVHPQPMLFSPCVTFLAVSLFITSFAAIAYGLFRRSLESNEE